MSSEYKAAKAGRLKLKGKTLPGAKKRAGGGKGGGSDGASSSKKAKADPDREAHGGWWEALVDEEVRGGEQIALELGNGAYMAAMDNGKFTVGPPRPKGQGPSPEEIFHVIRTPDQRWLALRTGFGKYVGVDAEGRLVGTAEAVGGREKWEPVFHEGKTAMHALGNSCFVSKETDSDGFVHATTKAAKETEMLKLRLCAERKVVEDWRPSEDRMESIDCEKAYRKMYQHTKVGLSERDVGEIRAAKDEGTLHETLLDRRKKMKSDKYC